MSASNGATHKHPQFTKEFLVELRAKTPMMSLVSRRVKLTRSGRGHVGCCPFHNDKTPSMMVYPDHFHCFGCQKRGDAIKFVELTEGIVFREAVMQLANEAGLEMPPGHVNGTKPTSTRPTPKTNSTGDWRPMVPPPDAPLPTERDLRCDTLHTYRDAKGKVLFYVRRFEAKNEKRKHFQPLTYGILDGQLGWHGRAPDALRPLYGLDKLTSRPEAPVMICEGEKAADAAQWLFPNRVCVSWMGGSQAVAKADWTPLVERKTDKDVWPDNDASGHAAAAEVAALLPGARLLRVNDLGPGDDAADIQPDNPEAWLRDHLPPEPALETPLPLLWFDDIVPVLDAKDFVQGLLVEGGAALVYGDSNTGKTFWVIDLALHVAAGKPWNGQRVDQGGVIYCALEGGNGFRNRVSAWRTANPTPDALTPFAAIPASLNLLDPEADTPGLIATIQAATKRMGQPVKLVVIDTLSRAMAGGNENAPDDMGALVRSMDAIRAATGACLLFVHHSGKDAAKGARGHSLLRAAVDTEIEVRADDDAGSRSATVVKQRELAKGAVFGFALDCMTLGQNQHGEEVTTCTVRPMAPATDADRKGKKLTTDEQGWLNDIQAFFAAPDQPHRKVQPCPDMPLVRGATRNALRDYLRHCGRISVAPGVAPHASMTATERSILSRGLNRLKDKNKIGIMDDWIWLL